MGSANPDQIWSTIFRKGPIFLTHRVPGPLQQSTICLARRGPVFATFSSPDPEILFSPTKIAYLFYWCTAAWPSSGQAHVWWAYLGKKRVQTIGFLIGNKKNQNVKSIVIWGLRCPKWWEDSKSGLRINFWHIFNGKSNQCKVACTKC